MKEAFLQSKNVSDTALLNYLEFKDSQYFEAFRLPQSILHDDMEGMEVVGRHGKSITSTYLLREWIDGQNPGTFQNEPNIIAATEIWKETKEVRHKQLSKWYADIVKEHIDDVYEIAARFNSYQRQIEGKYSESDAALLRSKRIIGCTTTAAAKYSSSLMTAKPDVLLVEEAGEILESHVLTALGPEVKQLVLIGDHKFVLPKCNDRWIIN